MIDQDAIVNELLENVTELCAAVKAMAERAAQGDRQASIYHVERFTFSSLLVIGRQFLTLYLAVLDATDTRRPRGYEGGRKQRKKKGFLSLFGLFDFVHNVYYPKGGGEGRSVLAEWADLPEGRMGYGVRELLLKLGVELPFDKAKTFFDDLFGISVSTRTCDDLVIGTDSHQDSYEEARQTRPAAEDEVVVASFDGKGVTVLASELRDQRGSTREALVGCDYVSPRRVRKPEELAHILAFATLHPDAEPSAKQPRRRPDIHYQASIRDHQMVWDNIALSASKRRNGNDLVVLIDGAHKLRDQARKIFPDAQAYVLDLMHVCGYLGDLAEALHPHDEGERHGWLFAHLYMVLCGRADELVELYKLKRQESSLSAAARAAYDTTITYFSNHLDLMHYDHYIAAGYPVCTGVVESACGHLVRQRLNIAGARWTLTAADAMLSLRATSQSHEFDAFFTHYREAEHERLYAA